MYLQKAKNLLDILSLPDGLKLKRGEPSFNLNELTVCHRLRRSGIEPAMILDVGANIGQFALAATTIWPNVPVHSFEPLPGPFAKLKDTASRHRMITPHHMALGAEPGNATMHVTNETPSSSMLKLHEHHLKAYPHIRESETIEVPVSTLEIIEAELPALSPRLLKIDVQGFESQVLKGAAPVLKKYRWIMLETSTTPMYEGETLFEDLSALLHTHGFAFRTPVHIHISGNGSFGQFDALFENTVS